MANKEKFNYKYSAPSVDERREIEGIRKQYLVDDNSNKLTRLRRLDSKVKSVALSVALIIGIGGTLIFGVGLTMILEWDLLVYGIITMVLAAGLMGLAYPLYLKSLNANKKKYGAEILKLTQELLNEYDK